MSKTKHNVMIIGAGSMGKAIAFKLTSKNWSGNITLTVKNTERRKDVGQEINGCGIKLKIGNTTDLQNTDILIIAVKPQGINVLCKELAGKINSDTILISIAAGTDIKSLTTGFKHEKVIRCMPNTALKIGKSVTTWMPSENVSRLDIQSAQALFDSWGIEHRVSVERHLDMATAIFGTGPALIDYFINEFYDGAIHIGFPKNKLMKLIMHMVVGTIELAKKEEGKHLAELINQVTSPGGTTAEALYVFKKRSFGATITESLIKAFEKIVNLR